MSTKSEKELIAAAKAGDEHSFELLILQCRTKAYNIALRYLRNEEDAMDALQESFIKIFRYLKNFKEDSKFDTWVYRIVVNTCNDMLRKNSALAAERTVCGDEEEDCAVKIPDSAPGPQEALLRREQIEQILKGMEQLKPEQREVIILRDIQGLSYEEVGSVLQCSIGTVKSRINRARGRLREILLEQNGDFFRLIDRS